MNWTRTVWTLADPAGRPARCLISEREGRWQVIVWSHRTLVLWERHGSSVDAWARADELRALLLVQGWKVRGDAQPDPGPELRACPACRRRQLTVECRLDYQLAFHCAACGHMWLALERLPEDGRRTTPQGQTERRRLPGPP